MPVSPPRLAAVILTGGLELFPRVAFDTETTGEKGGLHATATVFGAFFALGDKQVERVYWFNFLDVEDEELESGIINIIRRLFTEGLWNIIFHHASFDTLRLSEHKETHCHHIRFPLKFLSLYLIRETLLL